MAAVAARQDAPAGYRYVRVLDRRTYATSTAAVTEQQRAETWVDAKWRGLQRETPATVVARQGDASVARQLAAEPHPGGGEQPYMLGDSTFSALPMERLPTEPRGLADLMLKSHFAHERPGLPARGTRL